MIQPTACHRNSSTRTRSAKRGLSLVELLCTLCISASTLLASANGMRDLMQSQRLQSVATELEGEIALAKSTAILHGQTVRLTVQPIDQGSCIMIHTGAKDACKCGTSGLPVCETTTQLMHVQRHDSRTGVRYLTSDMSLTFSAHRGTVTPTATFKVSDSTGRTLHQIVNVMGRTRTCTPKGQVPGFKLC
jgi:type IV fimbrial biogenesis protein FimT